MGAAVAVIAMGTAVALAGGLIADAALQSSPFFQQVRFGAYYLGFAAIVAGTTIAIRATTTRSRWIIRILVSAFALALIVGAVFVCVPATFVLNRYHEQIQLVIYWVPMLVATGGGAIALLAARGDAARRTRLPMIAAFEGLLFVGLLREAQIIPDLGEPLANLLVAFGPFVIGAVLLMVSVAPRARESAATVH